VRESARASEWLESGRLRRPAPVGPCAVVNMLRERSLKQIDPRGSASVGGRRTSAAGALRSAAPAEGRTYPRRRDGVHTHPSHRSRSAVVAVDGISPRRFKTLYPKHEEGEPNACPGSIGTTRRKYYGALSSPLPEPPAGRVHRVGRSGDRHRSFTDGARTVVERRARDGVETGTSATPAVARTTSRSAGLTSICDLA